MNNERIPLCMKKTILSLLFILMGSLTSWAENQGYAILEGGTFTFKYGEKPAGDNVYDTDDTAWETGWDASHFNKVVFDPSFANARPKSTSGWFWRASSLTSIEGIQYLNTSCVTDMGGMFERCSSLKTLDLSNFDTRNVTNMRAMFYMCENLTNLDVSHFDTRNVTTMANMFYDCCILASLDVSHFDTSNVTDMGGMFGYCSGLTSLDVSRFNTSKVTSMSGMFEQCSSLKSLDVSHFDTSNVSGWGMYYMFYNCCSLTYLDVSHFDTSNVIIMQFMFGWCSSLTSLDISNFSLNSVTENYNIQGLFNCCKNLRTIYVSDKWNTDHLSNTDDIDMFYGCDNLIGGKGTTFNEGHISIIYARIDGGAGAPGYFTATYTEEGVSYIYEEDGSMAVRNVSENKEEVEIPSSLDISGEVHTVEVIMSEAFMGNDKLRVVSIPETIKEIGESAFAGCTNLADIYCYVENPIDLTGSVNCRTRNGSIASQVFAGVDKEACVLWVPESCASAYRNAEGWCEFKQIKELKRGDVNDDGKLDVDDIKAVVDYILTGKTDAFDFENADLNGDKKVDAADLVMLINKVK